MSLTAVLTPVEGGGFNALNPETGATTDGDTLATTFASLVAATAEQLKARPEAESLPVFVECFNVPDELFTLEDCTHGTTFLSMEQRTALANLLYRAFVMLRSPGYRYFWRGANGSSDCGQVNAALERSIAFGEALHNVPLHLYSGRFNFDVQIQKVSSYVGTCPDLQFFVDELVRIQGMMQESAA